MPSYTENALAAAINAVNIGTPFRRAAYDYGIPEATLRHRRTGRQSKIDIYTSEQKLSPIQENRLAEWIRIQDALGLGPTYAQIHIFVSRILLAGGSTAGIGKHWLKRFLQYNPSVKTLQTRRIDIAHINRATTEVIQA